MRFIDAVARPGGRRPGGRRGSPAGDRLGVAKSGSGRRLRIRPHAYALVTVFVVGLWWAGSAHADTVTVTAPAPVTLQASATTSLSGASVSDTTNPSANLLVTVSTTLGSLTIATTSGLTLTYGYSSFSGPTISFTGDESDVNTALATLSLTGGGTPGTATVSTTATVEQSGVQYLPPTHHYYEFVSTGSSPVSWNTAQADANALTFDGQEGYLATIPTAAVNTFIEAHLQGATNVWAGGQDVSCPTEPGAARVWCWNGQPTAGQANYGGPLAQTVFTECSNASNGCDFLNTTSFFGPVYPSANGTQAFSTTATGVWNTSESAGLSAYDQEPNNSGGSEMYQEINYSNGSPPGSPPSYEAGSWNDVSVTNSSASGYVVEFGDETTGASSWTGQGSASSNSTLATAPAAPSGVTATPGATDSANLSVSWSAPGTTNGSPITAYTVTATPTSGNSSAQTCVTTGATSCTVGSLAPGVGYTVAVTATNAYGTGVAASTTATAPAAHPDAPTSPAATAGAAGSGALAVSWSAPASDGGNPVTGYTATATPQSGGTSQSCTTSGAATCTITGLTASTTYVVSVSDATIVGSSPVATVNAQSPAAIVPDVPTGLGVTAGAYGSAQLTVSWSAPADDGDSPITGYTVTATPLSGPGSAQTCSTTTATSCVVSGLTPGAGYTVAVAAINAIGTGTSATSTGTAPISVPGVPSGLTLTSGATGSGTVTVSWSAPATGGSTITGYAVTATPVSGSGVQSCNTTTALSCAIVGLTPGAAYTLSVSASNLAGAGTPGSTTASAPLNLPDAPTGIITTPGVAGSASIVVSWTAPVNDGGSSITGYSATATPAAGPSAALSCTTVSATSCTITGLTPSVAYTLTVADTTVAGNSQPATTYATAPAATAPDAPSGLIAVPGQAGSGAVTLAWTAPDFDGGSPVTVYTVIATAPGAAGSAATCTATLLTTCTITGLDAGTDYTFSLTASNAIGQSATTSVTAQAPIAAPTTPSMPVSVPSGVAAAPATTVEAGLTARHAGVLTVPLSCTGLGACTATATLTTRSHHRTLTLAEISEIQISAGEVLPIRSSVTAAARRALYRAAPYRVRATLTVDSLLADESSAVSVQRIWINVSRITHAQNDVGRLTAGRIGRLRIGLTWMAAERLGRHWRMGSTTLRFAVRGGAIRAIFPSVTLRRSVPAGRRRRVIALLTANPRYAADGITADMTVRQARDALHLDSGVPVGATTWYFRHTPSGVLVLQARGGVIRQVGVAAHADTRTRALTLRLAHSL